MLVDYISPEKLPAIIVWLDWHIYAHWGSLLVCLFFSTWFYLTGTPSIHWSLGVYSISLFVGASVWVVFCAYTNGLGVG